MIASVFFIPGALVGGVVGWIVIRSVNWALARFFGGFNWVFDRVTAGYGRIVGWSLRLAAIVLLLYAGLLGLTVFGLIRVPTGFIPGLDQGYLIVDMELPEAAALDRTLDVTEKVGAIAQDTEGVEHTLGISGQSFVQGAVASNYASMFIILKPFEERNARD